METQLAQIKNNKWLILLNNWFCVSFFILFNVYNINSFFK